MWVPKENIRTATKAELFTSGVGALKMPTGLWPCRARSEIWIPHSGESTLGGCCTFRSGWFLKGSEWKN